MKMMDLLMGLNNMLGLPTPPPTKRDTGSRKIRFRTGAHARGAFKKAGRGRARRSYRMLPKAYRKTW